MKGKKESQTASDGSKQRCRPLRSQLSFLRQADGSCALEQGRTVVWCGINGPGDVSAQKRADDSLCVEVSYKQLFERFCSSRYSGLILSVVKQTVDCLRYPRTCLSVALQELQADGSLLASALTCTCLALLDSGIGMSGVFCGVCVAVVNDSLVLDPNAECESKADSIFTFTFKSPSSRSKSELDIIGCDTLGTFEFSSFEAARELAASAAKNIFMFFRESLQRKLSVDMW